MRIDELYIEDFGGLSKRSYELSEGINLITGSNESGKSTVAAFIRYLFYGFSDRKEKLLHSDIKTGLSSGSAVFETDDGRRYRITRRETKEGKPSVEVYTETGALCEEWKDMRTPGEYFFGVPEELFIRSAFVSQRDGLALSDSSSDALRDLMLTATEVTELRRALKKLDDTRVELLHKNGKGGRIYDLEREAEKLERSIESDRERHRLAKLSEDDIAAEQAELESTRAEISELEQTIALKNAHTIGQLLTEKHELERRCSENEEKSFALELEYKYNGFIPDEEYVRELRDAERAVLVAENDEERRRSQMNTPESAGVAVIRERGGVEAVKSRAHRLGLRFKRSLIACAVSAPVIGGSLALAIYLGKLPIYALFAASLIAFGVSLCCLLRARSAMSALLASLSVGDVSELIGLCERYDENARLADEIRQAYERAAEAKESAIERCTSLLERWGRKDAEAALADAERYLSANEELRAKKEKLCSDITLACTKLGLYPPQDIKEAEERMARGEEAAACDTETELSALEGKRDLLVFRQKATEERLAKKRIEYAERFSALPRLSEAEGRFEALRAERARLCELYDATKLAYDSLKGADAELRRRIAPYLSDTAGELFSGVTDGRYGGIGVDGETSLRLRCLLDGDYLPSEYLSAGASALAWLCLRLAIYSRISEAERLPLILDECFVCLDDVRLGRILAKLSAVAAGGSQIFLFSANRRELELCGSEVNVINMDALPSGEAV